MSLTTDDLQQIRLIIREEAQSVVGNKLIPIRQDLEHIKGTIEALENDIKDIYTMI